MGSAHYEPPGGIYKEPGLLVQHMSRDRSLDHILDYFLPDLIQGYFRIMLAGNHNGIYRTGIPFSYWTVIWVLPSGRR
jgi:hypothetical protein